MTRPKFTEEFKIDAIKQITERGYSVPTFPSVWVQSLPADTLT